MAKRGKTRRIEKHSSSVPTKSNREEEEKTDSTGVVYVGHIPFGFFEEQLKGYFGQFGRVTKVKLFRSKKTGNSKGYAFIEFQFAEVAKIVANTMNNYLMFNKLLKCVYIPADKVHPCLFRNWNRPFQVRKAYIRQVEVHNKVKTESKVQISLARALKRLKTKQKKLAALGIDYAVDNVAKSFPSIIKRRILGNKITEDSDASSLYLVKDSSSDVEITFNLPPRCIRSSKVEELNEEDKARLKQV